MLIQPIPARVGELVEPEWTAPRDMWTHSAAAAATTTHELDLHAEPGLEADFFREYAKRVLGNACSAGLFPLKSCGAGAIKRPNRDQGRAPIKHGLVGSGSCLAYGGAPRPRQSTPESPKSDIDGGCARSDLEAAGVDDHQVVPPFAGQIGEFFGGL